MLIIIVFFLSSAFRYTFYYHDEYMMRPQSARDNTEIHFQQNRISIRRFVCYFSFVRFSVCYFCRELEIAYVIWKIIMTSK